MARYIDADALIKKIFPYNVADKRQYSINAYAIYKAISEAPTVDIVPKSEVERLSKELDELAEEYSNLIIEKDKTFDEAEAWYKKAKELETELNAMRGAANSYKMHYNNLVREIFEEIEKCKVVMGCPVKIITFRYNSSKRRFEEYVIEGDIVAFSDIAELKKKYTEGE